MVCFIPAERWRLSFSAEAPLSSDVCASNSVIANKLVSNVDIFFMVNLME
jgi:hypothetical protein